MASEQPYKVTNGNRRNILFPASSIEMDNGTTVQSNVESLQQTYESLQQSNTSFDTFKDSIENKYRKANTVYAKDTMAYANELPAGFYLECTTAGTTGSTLPSFANVNEGDTVTDGTVIWLVKRLSDAATINGLTVESAVPANAKFTDTTYSNMSASEASAGTATTARTITAKVLADYVASCIAALVNSAPATLDTLKELSDALGNDPDFATTMATALGEKLGKTETAVNAQKVNNHTVDSDVPSGAKFTDTTYTAASATPKANGTAAVGTSAKYAREDHVHPLQTSVSGSSGSCTGNAATATKATQDKNGKDIATTYLPLAGGTMTGSLTSTNSQSVISKQTNITRGTSTTAAYPFAFKITDNTNNTLGGLYYEYLADKTAKSHLMCYQGTTGDNKWSSIGVGFNNAGNPCTWAPTPTTGDNSSNIATTAFVYNNAAKHMSAATNIYVAKAATGNGSGSNTSNYMSLADLRTYLATVHMHSSTSDMNGSYTLTLLFKAGDSFGNATIDAAKMPGVRNLILTTSTGTASTTSNYSTNSPTFGNITVTGSISVTMRNLNCTGRVQAQFGAYVAIDTYMGLSSLHASNYGYVNVAKDMVINVCDAHTDYLFAAFNNGILAMWPGATITINFRQQCYYTRCLFASSANGTAWIGYSSFKLTGTTPMAVWGGSGTLTGTSSTAAGTVQKDVTLASGQSFTLSTNATAKVKFTVDNTAANPTLNINGTGAKPIYWNNAAVPATVLMKNIIYDVKYNGTQYIITNTVKRLTNNDFGTFRSTGNYNQTYNSGSWNFTGWNLSYGNGIENSNWRGNHIGNIQQVVSTANNTYPILFTGTANATASTSTVPYFGKGIKANPSTSTVVATTFQGALSGNASTATKINGKTVPVVSSFDSTTGTLELTGLS